MTTRKYKLRLSRSAYELLDADLSGRRGEGRFALDSAVRQIRAHLRANRDRGRTTLDLHLTPEEVDDVDGIIDHMWAEVSEVYEANKGTDLAEPWQIRDIRSYAAIIRQLRQGAP